MYTETQTKTETETKLNSSIIDRPFKYEPNPRTKSENAAFIWHRPGNSTDFLILLHVTAFRSWSVESLWALSHKSL